MSLGTLRQDLTTCCAAADQVVWFRGENINWDLSEVQKNCVIPATMLDKHDAIVSAILKHSSEAHASAKKRHVVIMSNGAFGGIYGKLTTQLA